MYRRRIGSQWHAYAPIRTAVGAGQARYDFQADSVYRDTNGDLLERMAVRVAANLAPAPAFRSEATVAAAGWLLWNHTVHHPQQVHLRAVYHAHNQQGEVQQVISVSEVATKQPGKLTF